MSLEVRLESLAIQSMLMTFLNRLGLVSRFHSWIAFAASARTALTNSSSNAVTNDLRRVIFNAIYDIVTTTIKSVNGASEILDVGTGGFSLMVYDRVTRGAENDAMTMRVLEDCTVTFDNVFYDLLVPEAPVFDLSSETWQAEAAAIFREWVVRQCVASLTPESDHLQR